MNNLSGILHLIERIKQHVEIHPKISTQDKKFFSEEFDSLVYLIVAYDKETRNASDASADET